MNIIEQLNWRYATKVFDVHKKISDKDFGIIEEALRLTPSSFGLQPWQFVLVTNPKTRASLVEHSWNQKQIMDASHLLVLCRKADMTAHDVDRLLSYTTALRKIDRSSLEMYEGMMKGFVQNLSLEQKEIWMEKQVYIALGNLMTVCAMMGIDSCPIEGFDKDAYNKILNLKESGLSAVVLCPVGYRSLADKHAKLAKVRYPIEDVVIRSEG